jgi:hypothetical protein
MVYTTEDGSLLGLWTAIRLIGMIREIQDPVVRAEILTKAQILLTAFCVELKSQAWDQTRAAPFSTGPGQSENFDAQGTAERESEADGGSFNARCTKRGCRIRDFGSHSGELRRRAADSYSGGGAD